MGARWSHQYCQFTLYAQLLLHRSDKHFGEHALMLLNDFDEEFFIDHGCTSR